MVLWAGSQAAGVSAEPASSRVDTQPWSGLLLRSSQYAQVPARALPREIQQSDSLPEAETTTPMETQPASLGLGSTTPTPAAITKALRKARFSMALSQLDSSLSPLSVHREMRRRINSGLQTLPEQI